MTTHVHAIATLIQKEDGIHRLMCQISSGENAKVILATALADILTEHPGAAILSHVELKMPDDLLNDVTKERYPDMVKSLQEEIDRLQKKVEYQDQVIEERNTMLSRASKEFYEPITGPCPTGPDVTIEQRKAWLEGELRAIDEAHGRKDSAS